MRRRRASDETAAPKHILHPALKLPRPRAIAQIVPAGTGILFECWEAAEKTTGVVALRQSGRIVRRVVDDRGRDLADLAFRQHSGRVYRFLLRKTGNHHDAEELTQRVFADAASALISERPEPKSLLAWLYAIADRRFVDEVRRHAVARRAFMLLPRSEEAADLARSRELSRALEKAILELPKEQRTVVIKKVLEGRPFTEIAAELGTTEAACKMRLSRAIAKIKRDLQDQDLQP